MDSSNAKVFLVGSATSYASLPRKLWIIGSIIFVPFSQINDISNESECGGRGGFVKDLLGGIWCYIRDPGKGVLPSLQTQSDELPWDHTECYGVRSLQLGDIEQLQPNPT